MRKYTATAAGAVALPPIVATVLTILAGAAQVANQIVFRADPAIRGGIAVVLVFLAGVGITPVVGAAFVAMLRLPKAVIDVVAAILSAIALAVSVIPMSAVAATVITTILTVAAALGFAPAVTPTPAVAPVSPVAPGARQRSV